jgi:hypothetical protein
MPVTIQTSSGGDSRQSRIFLHGLLLPALGVEVVAVAEDIADGNLVRACRLTDPAPMAAIEGSE